MFYGAVNSQARLVPIIGSVNLLRVRRRATAGFPIQAYYDKSLQWVRADHWPPKHFLHFECCWSRCFNKKNHICILWHQRKIVFVDAWPPQTGLYWGNRSWDPDDSDIFPGRISPRTILPLEFPAPFPFYPCLIVTICSILALCCIIVCSRSVDVMRKNFIVTY